MVMRFTLQIDKKSDSLKNGVAIQTGKLSWESMEARHFVNEAVHTGP